MKSLVSSRRTLPALLAVLALPALPAAASAAAPPTLLKPATNAVIGVGTQPTFTARDKSQVARRYKVWIIIAGVKRVKHGELQQDNAHGTFSDMKRKSGGRYSFTPKLYTFPDYFLQRPGRYWWQAFHIDCSSGARNCHILSKIRSFMVR